MCVLGHIPVLAVGVFGLQTVGCSIFILTMVYLYSQVMIVSVSEGYVL